MRLHELGMEGLGYREIARRTGHSRNTVRRYLRDGAGRNETVRAPRRSKLDPFKDTVAGLVKGGLVSTPAIMDRIVPLGYTGKETTLRDYVRSIKPKASKEAALARRYETKPGEQLQFDWGIFTYKDASGDERRIPGLVATLGYSRASYLAFAPSADIYGLIGCLVNAFSYFGGLTNAVLTDHMKTVVLGSDGEDGWRYHPQMEDLARYLGISIRLCRVRRPETKGKVERHIRYAKENFWPERTFTDLADLNEQALNWCRERNRRLHPSIGRTPLEALAEESQALKPLPEPAELERFYRRIRRVSLDGLVSFGGVCYGVPISYGAKTVTVIPRERTIEIYSETGERIVTHPLAFKTRSIVWLPGQYRQVEGSDKHLLTPGRAHQVEAVVETRSLSEYEVAAGA
ncbi:MAG: IS21 family transposase [Actinomycetota bacterium]|nr:IS21 family transposase [Actinomycetota bacterium]